MFVFNNASHIIYEDNGLVLGKVVDRLTTTHPRTGEDIEWFDCVTVWSEDPLAPPRQAVNKAKALAGMPSRVEAKWVYLVLTGRITSWTSHSMLHIFEVKLDGRTVQIPLNYSLLATIQWAGAQTIPFMKTSVWFYPAGAIVAAWTTPEYARWREAHPGPK